MITGLNPFVTNSDVARSWFAALFDEHMGNLTDTTPSEDELENYANDADDILRILRKQVKNMIAEVADLIYAGRIPAEIRSEIEKNSPWHATTRKGKKLK